MEERRNILLSKDNFFHEKTITLNSTNSTGIIECSVTEEDNEFDFIKKGKIRSRNVQFSSSPQYAGEFEDCQSPLNTNKALRVSLSKNYGLQPDVVSMETLLTPCPGNLKEPNSVIKRFISTIKKTPDAPYLSKSKLRNIEEWLKGNDVETVQTPPFANLSVTPRNSFKSDLLPHWKSETKRDEESFIDSDVEGILKAVYGDDWKTKNIQSRTKTEPKRNTPKYFSPVTDRKKKKMGVSQSVRRNILNNKKLNLLGHSNKENNLDNSILFGLEMINLDSSFSSIEEGRAKTKKKNLQRKKKCIEEIKSEESFCMSPVEKITTKISVSEQFQNDKPILKLGSNKKMKSEASLKTPKKTFLASLSVSTPTSRCHPDAQYYKINFKNKKEELVGKLYKLYNSEVFDGKLSDDMNFSWNVKLRGTAGYCYNKRVTKSTGDIIRLSRIEFSTKIVDRADRLRDTMIHELCHAASWIIDGVLDGHGEIWTKWAYRAMKRFPELPEIKRCHNYDIVSKYVYRCTSCGYSIKRHSKSINTERKRCGHCYGVLELLINKKKKGKAEVPEFNMTRTLPTPNKFAIFVKENYHSVKNNHINAKHSEIMKILSKQYALVKKKSATTNKCE